MIYKRIFACLLIAFSNMADAETWKCIFPDGHVEYRAFACPSVGAVIKQQINVGESGSPDLSRTGQINPQIETLNRLFNDALASGDLRKAKELALTQEHWNRIREAQKPRVKSADELRLEKADSAECEQASRSYEIASGAFKQDQNLIDAKKRIMYRACGMDEPTSVNVNNTVNFHR